MANGSLVNFRSFQDMMGLIQQNAYRLGQGYDLVVGIPRSGIIPANMIALLKNLPFTDISGLVEARLYPPGSRKKVEPGFFDRPLRVLVVDDSVNSGTQLKETRAMLEERLAGKNYELSYCAIYVTEVGKDMVDHYFEVIPIPRIFGWNVLHSWVYEVSCVDLDGVLCLDPANEDNDDGEAYLRFITNAPPLHRPKTRIKNIVTSRLEKYRKPTEAWLEQQGIEYEKLYMLNLATAEERRKKRIHAKFKASIYRQTDTLLFIESARWQAQEINQRTKKPAFCVDTHEMFDTNPSGGITQYRINRSKTKVREMLRRFLPG